ncbi:MAG: capsular polysaccharide biosynthesis protein [Verrucomicrobiales bacterium]|nr:capsular polysaccharide biosynthesis protein [Verrucomicrobiales bacterium]
MTLAKLKSQLKTFAIKGVNTLGPTSKLIGSPRGLMDIREWINRFGNRYGAAINEVMPGSHLQEKPPFTLETKIHRFYQNEINREIWPVFVATIPCARVWGRCGTVIAPNDILLTDVSREFGAYGGITGRNHSVNKRFALGKCSLLQGKAAIIGSAGAANYHHFLYDTVCRVHALKLAGVFDQIDHFIFDYTGLRFQKESIKLLGIPEEKIIRANDTWKFHIEVESLFIPSLPARLGTISPWMVEFLRTTFLKEKNQTPARLYISRKKAPTRKVANETAVMDFLKSKGFIEFFAEDHSLVETAAYFAAADSVVGVHGSGFANLAFSSSGTRVIDIVAPRHLDAYYWMITNATHSSYGYLFGKGDRPDEGLDLVTTKIDHDIEVNIGELEKLLHLMESK